MVHLHLVEDLLQVVEGDLVEDDEVVAQSGPTRAVDTVDGELAIQLLHKQHIEHLYLNGHCRKKRRRNPTSQRVQ